MIKSILLLLPLFLLPTTFGQGGNITNLNGVDTVTGNLPQITIIDGDVVYVPTFYTPDIFWAIGRNGLTMPDSLGDNDVTITTPTFRGYTGTSLVSGGGTTERIFNGASYTIYFKMRMLAETPGTNYPFRMGNSSSASQRGMAMYIISTNLYTTFCDGTHISEAVEVSTINTTLLNAGWVEVFIEIDKTANRARCNIYKLSDGSSLGTPRNVDISAWDFTDVDNTAALTFASTIFAYADIKKFNALKTIAQCRTNSYVTDLQWFYPTVTDGTDVSGNAHHLTRNSITNNNKYYSNVSTYLLDNGYSLYQNTSNLDYIFVPYGINGLPVARTWAVTSLLDNHPGELLYHNFADSKLDIPVAQWDKSSYALFDSAVRASTYYNSLNTDEWHISELDYLLYSYHCKTSHKATNFFKVEGNSMYDREALKELFSYASDKASNLTTILDYTTDQTGLDNSVQLYCDASVEADARLKITGYDDSSSVQVYWGDGVKTVLMTMDGNIQYVDHTYAGTSVYPINVCRAENIYGFDIGTTLGTDLDIAPLNRNIAEFNKCTRLKRFWVYPGNGVWIGTINGLATTLENLYLAGTGVNNNVGGTYAIGNISRFINLKTLRIFGENAITGSIETLVNLEDAYIAGKSTISGDASACTKLTNFETAMAITGWSLEPYLYVSDITAWPNIKSICTNISLTGVVTTLTAMNYLSSSHYPSHLTGVVTNLVEMWFWNTQGTFTGDISGWTKLCVGIFGSTHTNVTKLTRVNNMPRLAYFNPATTWAYSSAEVNQILADVWTNRNQDKTNVVSSPVTTRQIILNHAGFGAPTGQGITDRDALRLYRSPTPPETAALWTIDVNP
jgi:hypothetical protein